VQTRDRQKNRRQWLAMADRFYVYILSNKPKGVLYVGVTNNLSRRVAEHKGKYVAGFTKEYGISELVYFEEHASILGARTRERLLKRWRRAWKIALIERVNPEWADLTDQLAL
jgi:putative endonuclease